MDVFTPLSDARFDMRLFSASIIFLAFSSLFIAGCPEAPSGLPTGPELSVDQRLAVVDAATEKLDTLVGKTSAEIGQAMLDWIKGRSEFSKSGITDEGDVWAYYTDGQLFLVPTNVDFAASVPGMPKLKYEHRVERALELPSTLNARLAAVRNQNILTLINSFGDWLTSAGYNVAVAHELTVEGFKEVNGSHSVVYLDTHGIRLAPNSEYNPGATHRFLLSTNTYATRTVLETYKEELRTGSLVQVSAFFGTVSPGGFIVRAKPALMITAKFVRENMRFAQDSFVFVNACSSYSTDFRDACFDVGASVYAGWSQPVFDEDALGVAIRLFDRMLGGNRDHPPTPKRSAQNWVTVYDELKSEGADTFPSSRGGQTQIILAQNPNGGEFAQFSPSISGRMRVDEEKGELTLFGFFGQRPGKVTINGTDLELVGSWNPVQLTCRIPASGANAAGDVQVVVDGRPSNKAQLTLWEGTFNLMSDGAGSLTTTAELSVRLRGDVRYDLTPDAVSPSTDTVAIWKANSDSTCRVNAFGENTEGSIHTTYALTGSSEIPLNRGFHNPANPDFVYTSELVPAQRTIYLLFEVRGVGKNLVTQTIGNDPPTTSSSVIGFWSSQFFEGVSPHKFRVPLLVGGDYTIVGGSQNAQDGGGNPLTLTWSAMAAQHPPDVTQGR